MTRTTKHVGLDVHQATIVTSVREDSGRVLARSVVPTEAAALLEYFRGMRGAVHVALEEGTQAQWLYDLLRPVVASVTVCDRRGERRSGRKDDHGDADELSDLLRVGRLRAVYHGGAPNAERRALREFARTYVTLVEDATRLMNRLKALYRARGIQTPGARLYAAAERAAWLEELREPAVRFRAEVLFGQLDAAQAVRPNAKQAMLADARQDPRWRVLRTIPMLGPVRVSLLLAVAQTPWRFRTKRQWWAYLGLAVVTSATAQYEMVGGRPVRRRRRPLTRGLNRNHNRVLKNVFKSAATAAAARDPALQAWYAARLAHGLAPEMARLTLARKLAALTLHIWKTNEVYDPTKLTMLTR